MACLATTDSTNLYYGIDIGGTKLEISIYDRSLNRLETWREQTPTKNYESFIGSIRRLVNDADIKFDVTGKVGIGIPGIFDKEHKLVSSNIPCAHGKFVRQDIENALNRQVVFGNDTSLFAISESNEGAGGGYKYVYGAIIGTGTAGGLCIDGCLYTGRNSVSGEHGHVPVSGYLITKYNLPVWQCGCGQQGCYEAYVSGPGLGRLYRFFGAETESTYDFVKELARDSEIAQKTFAVYMELLGASLVSIVLSYDPDVIVLGGGISKLPQVSGSVEHYLQKHLYQGVDCPKILPAKFGDSSGVRGAAILRRQQDEAK